MKSKGQLAKIRYADINKIVYEPGWKWSVNVKPLVKTDLCMMTHYLYMTSGTLHVKLSDGTETDVKKGSVAIIPPGHDAWVVGNEPAMGIDLSGVMEKG